MAGIQTGSASDWNAPIRVNNSPTKPEKPGRPREAKNAMPVMTVYLGMTVIKPR
ncbi:hypothetical protein D3C87_1954600 [compost metagenome]